MTSVASPHAVGAATSGDVSLFFRRFGDPAQTPALILHGANYYDSRDWVGVASALAVDREVVAYDARGYGLSTWSAGQDYSLDANLLDVRALLDQLGWRQAVLVGHSRGGSFALRFAHEHPDRVAGLVLVDFSPGQTPGRARVAPVSVGRWGAVYASLEQAHAATSRDVHELESEGGRARVESIFAPRDGGWVNIRRDPAFAGAPPTGQPGRGSALGDVDLWDALAGFVGRGRPALVIRATESASYDDAALTRLRTGFAAVGIVEVVSGHDVPGAAPRELAGAARDFLSASLL